MSGTTVTRVTLALRFVPAGRGGRIGCVAEEDEAVDVEGPMDGTPEMPEAAIAEAVPGPGTIGIGKGGATEGILELGAEGGGFVGTIPS